MQKPYVAIEVFSNILLINQGKSNLDGRKRGIRAEWNGQAERYGYKQRSNVKTAANFELCVRDRI